jgi:CPA2 family monovalent cation:H+ antiporter-2
MHQLAPLVKDLAIILGVASIVVLIFQKIRQPIILGYLVAGIIVGPYAIPQISVTDVSNIQIWSELGVIFLMFTLGLEFSFQKLKRVGFTASITGALEVFFMLLIGYITGKLLGWSFYDCIFLAAALAISSTVIIIKALEDLKLKTQHFADIVFGVLIMEDLLAILLLVALSTMVATNQLFSSTIAWLALKLLLIITIFFALGRLFFLSFFRKFMEDVPQETLTICAIALCLTLVWIANSLHYSTALGAFMMGSILAETNVIEKIKLVILPIRNIFSAIFFVSVGMLIDPKIIWHELPIITIICAVTIVGKLLTTALGAFFTGQSKSDSIRIGFSMAQIGEFSFVIASLGLALNVISAWLYPIIVAVSMITTFTTPYLIKLSGRIKNSY